MVRIQQIPNGEAYMVSSFTNDIIVWTDPWGKLTTYLNPYPPDLCLCPSQILRVSRATADIVTLRLIFVILMIRKALCRNSYEHYFKAFLVACVNNSYLKIYFDLPTEASICA